MTGPRELIEAYWRAEERRDLDGVLDHYTEDAELVVPEMGRLVGHSEIRKFYEESIERFPELRVDIVRGIVDGPSGAFEWASVHRDRASKEYPCAGVNLVDVHEGRLQRVHVYYDPAVFALGN
jgi:ketosteroid isomerase-like protein